jgi:hypothetical protein
MGKKYSTVATTAQVTELEAALAFEFVAYEGIKPSRAAAIKQGNKALAMVLGDREPAANHKMSSDKRGRRPVVAEVNSEVAEVNSEDSEKSLTITADWAGYWKGGKGRNAKTELLAAVGIGSRVKAAILYPAEFGIAVPTQLALGVGYSEEEWSRFLEALDFEYNSGYGSQELDGTIWFEDGTWMTRREYDGSESWEKHQQPELPEICR